ncbi:MAG: Mannose-1-phosphate guanylyltransferase, partial [Candidatus Woesebacteria bacterium GW2011_GWB1_38_5]
PFLNGKSFFQLTYQRFRKQFAPEEIFVSTEENYTSFIRKQAPEVPRHNIISEPERKDLLAACGLATAVVNKYFPGESVLISWAKHLIARESVFLDAVMAAGDFADKTGLIVSVDSKPSYPSVHNGWVRLGKKIGRINEFNILQIEKHVEKPEKELAEKLFKEGGWLINTGYRVWKTDVMLSHYKKFQPKMYDSLMEIVEAWGTKKHSENNLIIGSKGKMIAVIGLSDIAVIDTADGLLVCKLDQTQKVKDLYANLEHYYKEYTK